MLNEYDSGYVEIDGKRYEKEQFFEAKVVKKLIKESEKYPLLTREQEQAFLAAYQEPRDALYRLAQQQYGRQRYPDPSSWNSEPERAVIRAILNPESPFYSKEAKEGRDKMVLHNLRLIKRFAKTRKAGDIGVFDSVIYGMNGLLHSVDKFDRTKRTKEGLPLKFSTYSTFWVAQYVQRSFVDLGRAIRIPIHIHDQINKLGKIYAQLASEHFDSPSPTPEKLSEVSGMPIEQVRILGFYKADFSITSLDRETFSDEEESNTLLDSMSAPDHLEPEQICEKELNKQALDNLIKSALAPDDAKFCALYYGLVDGSPRSVREMASAMGVPRREIQDRVDRIMLALQSAAKRDQFSLED